MLPHFVQSLGDAPSLHSVTNIAPRFTSFLGDAPSLRSVAGGCSFTSFSSSVAQSLCSVALTLLRFALLLSIQWFHQTEKMCQYPHTNKLLQKCVIFNEAINLYSRGSTEQHFYVWEPRCGCLRKVKKVCWYPFIKEGQRSHKYAF